MGVDTPVQAKSLDISELPDAPRTRDISFYFVAFVLVAPLRAVAPLSWAFVLYSLHTGSIWSFAWKGRLAFALAICEVFFSVYHRYLVALVSVPWKHGTGDIIQLQVAFTRVLKAGLANLPEYGYDEESLDVDRPGSPSESITQLEANDHRAMDFRNVIRTWFGRVPWSSIRRVEIQKWIYWSIFNKDLPEPHLITPTHQAVLDDTLQLLEMRLGTRVAPGSNPDISPMRMTIDPVIVTARPLIYYAFVSGINRYLRGWYRTNWNLRHGNFNDLEYLVYTPETWDPIAGPSPIVFLHGLGLGLFQYSPIIRDLHHQFPDRPLLIPLQPHISQDIFHPKFLDPLFRQDLADRLAGLLRQLGWVSQDGDDLRGSRGVTMLSHSNGSYLHAWCLKRSPELVSRSCFVDPVTFCSWEGDSCYNFLYRRPSSGMDLLIRYFVGTELGVANMMRRNFDWSSNSLWYEEIPNARNPSKTLFLFGGSDDIIDGERVKKYLTSHGVKQGLVYNPSGRHGEALISGGPQHAEVMRWLKASDK
ncbi:hypothetical protein B0H15DRAFT_830514 [Mycena belliarum]|uniref:Alpha/beta-hydrolase n=1 Tax=Mycena belliarum TaxID=1033014 RepID=A0AAD6XRS1_9AGAR|nr:hypothetical protein B0H15DRAFT_830514 [Mycena belliae]